MERGLKYLDSSWKTDKSRSSNPDASASKFGRDRIAWFRGTMAKEVSFWSGRWEDSVSLSEIRKISVNIL